MTSALIASLLLNLLLGFLFWNARRAAKFWQRNYDWCHRLFMGQLRSEHGRHQAELRDTLQRIHAKRERREWN